MVMASNNTNIGLQRRANEECRTIRSSLRTEIGFWRDLIGSCGESQSTDSLERMKYALALAEARLENLPEPYADNETPDGVVPTNIVHLDAMRGVPE